MVSPVRRRATVTVITMLVAPCSASASAAARPCPAAARDDDVPALERLIRTLRIPLRSGSLAGSTVVEGTAPIAFHETPQPEGRRVEGVASVQVGATPEFLRAQGCCAQT
ncbi:hypothetical protein [Nocardia abscessus]|uniref:hypothetical protein n=1 Tax=Nocardia abscessus TaxID=120957 RepID=UPI0005B98157|nr:hypothetical protein [Nocardia abscessus]MCC3332486.1 hypothetical protein [Nocardia abscessus]